MAPATPEEFAEWFQENRGLVYHVAKKFRLSGLEQNELVSETVIAMMLSMRTYNPSKGVTFENHAANFACTRLYKLSVKSRFHGIVYPTIETHKEFDAVKRDFSYLDATDPLTNEPYSNQLAGDDGRNPAAKLDWEQFAANLSAPERSVLELHYVHGLNDGEICERFGRKSKWTARTLTKAIECLKKARGSGDYKIEADDGSDAKPKLFDYVYHVGNTFMAQIDFPREKGEKKRVFLGGYHARDHGGMEKAEWAAHRAVREFRKRFIPGRTSWEVTQDLQQEGIVPAHLLPRWVHRSEDGTFGAKSRKKSGLLEAGPFSDPWQAHVAMAKLFGVQPV